MMSAMDPSPEEIEREADLLRRSPGSDPGDQATPGGAVVGEAGLGGGPIGGGDPGGGGDLAPESDRDDAQPAAGDPSGT
jgi:hypothetical protein